MKTYAIVAALTLLLGGCVDPGSSGSASSRPSESAQPKPAPTSPTSSSPAARPITTGGERAPSPRVARTSRPAASGSDTRTATSRARLTSSGRSGLRAPVTAAGGPALGYSGAAVDHPKLPRAIIGTWMARSSWKDLEDGNWLGAFDNPYHQWLRTNINAAKAADVAVPLVPTAQDPTRMNWNLLLGQCARGERDGTYRVLGRHLAEEGPDTVYARLWWEMNEYPSNIDSTLFSACWNRAAPLIKSGFADAARPRQTMMVVYCYMASHGQGMAFYPGDASVDVIAADVYGGVWASSPPTSRELLANVDASLRQLRIAGLQHRKPVALGEWGNVARGSAPGTYTRGLGDFVPYIDHVLDWLRSNHAVYAVYFDIEQGSVGQTLSDTPYAVSELASRW